MKYLEATLLVLIGGMLLLVGLTVRKFVADLDASIPVASSRLNATLSGVDKAVGQVQTTIGGLNAAAASQQQYWDREKVETLKITAGAKSLIDRTDCSLNGGPGCAGAIKQLGDSLAGLSALTARVSTDFDATTLKAKAILDGVAESTATVNRTLPAVMQNLSDTSAQTLLVARNTAETTASIDASAHDVQQFVHRETAPVTGTWGILKAFLREFAGPAASVATAIK